MNAWLPEGMAASVYWPDTESMLIVLNEEFNHGTQMQKGIALDGLKNILVALVHMGYTVNAYSWK